MNAIAISDYYAVSKDEISIKKGDKLKNVVPKRDYWVEGEIVISKKRGVFPESYIRVRILIF